MHSLRASFSTLWIVGAALTLFPYCNGSGAAPAVTVTLKGDAVCTKPIRVTGTAMNDGVGTLTVTPRIQCGTPPTGVMGVVLVGRLATATGDRDYEFPPTVNDGSTTKDFDVSSIPVLPSQVKIRVLDASERLVDESEITIQ